ncbi:hypothetical protein [Flavobacterium davisii]|uniref:Uncharacterized protein n=1 Tax=Flavobacterium columnare TaxID=996 RepID=A0A8G0KTL4_9FLAO|nr:hypothetical protein [Flavobacterium davisii]QYS88242.1 hypothetical protein JJC05_10765 [Flavobacterium davisii]
MISEFIKLYGQLSDSWVNEVTFIKSIEDNKEFNTIKLKINCCNLNEDFRYETLFLFLQIL